MRISGIAVYACLHCVQPLIKDTNIAQLGIEKKCISLENKHYYLAFDAHHNDLRIFAWESIAVNNRIFCA